jgi:hypothetical protein
MEPANVDVRRPSVPNARGREVDTAAKPIEPSDMHGSDPIHGRRARAKERRSLLPRHAPVWGAMILLLACSSSTPPPDDPSSDPVPSSSPDPTPAPDPTGEPEPSDPPPKKPSSSGSIPDDYEMTNKDCVELGKQLKAVIRNDEVAKLSPKLKQNQRDAAEESIDRAATTRQDQWVDGCQKSLVGKVVEQKSLKCAVSAKSVKEFDGCLNAASEPPAK